MTFRLPITFAVISAACFVFAAVAPVWYSWQVSAAWIFGGLSWAWASRSMAQTVRRRRRRLFRIDRRLRGLLS